jgi:ubiquinone biosynthesis accessory factor UbiJ
MLDAAFVAPINHVLRAAPWALAKLSAHAGKTALFKLGPASFRYTVTDSGEVRASAGDAQPNAEFIVTPGLLARAVADRDALNEAQVSGDSAFAADIAYVAKYLSWDAEEDLSKVIGDIAAHRVASGARAANHWRAQAQRSVMEAAKDYLTEERAVLAKRESIETFLHEVDRLRDDTARLEKRVEQLRAEKSTEQRSESQ